MDKVFLKECYICETNKFDALVKEVWKKIKVTESVVLSCLEKEDKDKVYVQIDVVINKKNYTKTIGSLSREDSESLIKYVEKGWGSSIYETRLCKVDDKADENKRFSVAIYIKAHNN